MILEFLPGARAELHEAAEYYESRQEGLAWRFRNEVFEVCGLLLQQPLMWRKAASRGRYRWLVSILIIAFLGCMLLSIVLDVIRPRSYARDRIIEPVGSAHAGRAARSPAIAIGPAWRASSIGEDRT